MKRFSLPRLLAAVVGVILVSLPASASACSICMGDVNSRTAPATNDAIFLMLGFIGLMFSALGGFAFYLFQALQKLRCRHTREVAQSMNPPGVRRHHFQPVFSA